MDVTTLNVLNLAAILGHRLNDLSMYALADLSIGQTMTGLATLVSRRVLRDRGHGLEFVNELVRTAAYLGVPSPLRRALHSGIADRFIQEEEKGSEALGLQIAWHCTRAGRLSEATPYLLRGARDALRRGAPYSAERALATAVPSLEGGDRNDALLLLAEALQEQARWQDSLEVLEQASIANNASQTDLMYVLTTIAQRRLSFLDQEQLGEIPPKLLNFIKTPGPSSSRVRAAVEAASILNILRYRGLTGALLEATSVLESSRLEDDDRCQLLLARAMLLYNHRCHDASIKEIETSLEFLKKGGAANSVVARLYSGLGINYSAQGSYALAIPWLQRAYNTSLCIGSDPVCEQAAGNLSLMHT
ncbi:MAG: hypothetical protein ACREBC_36160, partial [Pyrinomonadaceae bacterium]